MTFSARFRAMGFLTTVAALCLAALPPASRAVEHDASTADYADAIRRTERQLKRAMKKHHLPSVAVALIDDQNVVWAEAFGQSDLEANTPATTRTIYRQWSLAKVMTAVETMRLVEQGHVDLDAPVTDYVPGFSVRTRFPQSAPITIRSILAHRSGLPRNGALPESHIEVVGLDVLRDQVMSLGDSYVAFPVGERFKYSNVGYDLLGHIIEEVRGQKYSLYMREHFLIPIGMDRSAFLSTQLPDDAEIAVGYEHYKGKHYPIRRGECPSFPSGNLFASLEDMAEFVKFIFRDGMAAGTQIVEPATLAAMFEDQYTNPMDPQTNGLGWFTNQERFGEKLVWHHGGDSGTNVLMALLPKRKLGVVLFANEVNFSGAYELLLAADVLESMTEAKYGEVLPSASKPKPIKLDRSTLSSYVGTYVVFGEVMDIVLRGDRLKAQVHGMKLGLVPIGENRFKLTHWLMKLGLARFFPVDLRQFELEFLTDAASDDTVLAIHGAKVKSEICPRCPGALKSSATWQKLSGRYEVVRRVPTAEGGEEHYGHAEISIEGNLIRTPMGVLHPISPTELLLIGGPYDGETVNYDPETRCLHRQGLIYRPIIGQ
ncbi:MAG: beta-lactamase family protein [bacterium]|nr:beta-lactamase family protein [bacterium]